MTALRKIVKLAESICILSHYKQFKKKYYDNTTTIQEKPQGFRLDNFIPNLCSYFYVCTLFNNFNFLNFTDMKNTEKNRIAMIKKAAIKTEQERDKKGYFGKTYVACINIFTDELLICTNTEAFNNHKYKDLGIV